MNEIKTTYCTPVLNKEQHWTCFKEVWSDSTEEYTDFHLYFNGKSAYFCKEDMAEFKKFINSIEVD